MGPVGVFSPVGAARGIRFLISLACCLAFLDFSFRSLLQSAVWCSQPWQYEYCAVQAQGVARLCWSSVRALPQDAAHHTLSQFGPATLYTVVCGRDGTP